MLGGDAAFKNGKVDLSNVSIDKLEELKSQGLLTGEQLEELQKKKEMEEYTKSKRTSLEVKLEEQANKLKVVRSSVDCI